MDFGIWVDKTTMAPTNMTSTTATDGQQGGEQPPSGNETPGPNTPSFSHQVQHSGIVCDNCNSTIFGFRYKCCQCKDFDLCSTCERSGLHAGHIMLRIAFPEMANDAIRSYILKSPQRGGPGTCPPPPIIPLGFAGGIPPPPPFDSDHGRKRHCKRERHSAHHAPSSPDSSDETPFPWGPRCPVMMGKKEIKKWAKCMKKTAHMHKRSAQAYASQVASGATASASAQAEANGSRQEGEREAPQTPFDFSAAASQIQEFLNAFGVPIDVVELYDEWGNRGGPNTNGAQEAPRNSQQNQAGPGESADASTQQGTLSDDLQKLNLGTSETPSVSQNTVGSGGSGNGNTEASVLANADGLSATAPTTGMEVEGEAGWTLLENDRVEAPIQTESSSVTAGDTNVRQIPITFDTTTPLANDTATRDAATPSDSGNAAPNSAETTNTGNVPRPIYPQLPPHLQQVVNGLSNTVGNVVRNIPIGSWIAPNGTGGSFARPTQQGSTEAPSTPSGQPELSERMQMTLNQLLSMGFSNHDGWLARLVASKNGNLEEVLNSLFPVGNTNTTA